MSTKYGKIEDMVAALQLVTGRGEKLELDCRQAGPDWVQLVVGSEGGSALSAKSSFSLSPCRKSGCCADTGFPT